MEGRLSDDWGNDFKGHRREKESINCHFMDGFYRKSQIRRDNLRLLLQIFSESGYLGRPG